jgi:hypothetical protein
MKKVAIGLAAAAVLVAGALLLAYHSLDVILKFAIEHYGPDVLGASVKVGEVRLSAGPARVRSSPSRSAAPGASRRRAPRASARSAWRSIRRPSPRT